MRLIFSATLRTRALVAPRYLIALAITLLFTGHAAAAVTPPTLAGVAPWSARCSTDTCVGFSVTFAGGHEAAIGYGSDDPTSWAIRSATDLARDEEAFAAATTSALARHDLQLLTDAYDGLPAWYLAAVGAYLEPATPASPDHLLFLPTVVR